MRVANSNVLSVISMDSMERSYEGEMWNYEFKHSSFTIPHSLAEVRRGLWRVIEEIEKNWG